MRICPQCRRTYDDETLNFCLDDGTVLTQDISDGAETPDTAEFGEAANTKLNQPFGTRQDWSNTPTYDPNSNGSSKTWMWVVGILLGSVLLCGGGGIVGLIAIGTMVEDEPTEFTNAERGSDRKPDKEPDNDKRKLVKSSDFSDWKFTDGKGITADNSGGKLVLTSKKGYFYVFAFKEFPTKNASAKVTVKNSTGKRTKYGFGLVVNSHPNQVLKKDYAFLIKSSTGQYSVVRHKDNDEKEIVKWTRSSAIRKGTRSNDLEVRISDRKMKFYINGKYIRTVNDTIGYERGVAGVYTSDNVPITFTDLELRK